MLRIHFPQNWFNLSDPTLEEALYAYRFLDLRSAAWCRSLCRSGGRRRRGVYGLDVSEGALGKYVALRIDYSRSPDSNL